MKDKIHKIGQHGAAFTLTKQGETCLECGELVNTGKIKPHGYCIRCNGALFDLGDHVCKEPIRYNTYTKVIETDCHKITVIVNMEIAEKLNDVIDAVNALKEKEKK